MKRLTTLFKRVWQAIFGKRPKDLNISVGSKVQVQDPSYGIHRHGGEEESLRIFKGDDQEIWTDVNSEGLVRSSFRGTSPQGESGTTEVCSRLIEKINAECQANWGDLEDVSESKDPEVKGIDCRAHDGNETLDIQVTRAVRFIWKDRNKQNEVLWNRTIETFADDIWDAIEEKSKPIPVFERERQVLALNALETPGGAVQQVVTAFRDKHGTKAKALGYQSIWIVSINAVLTSRLD